MKNLNDKKFIIAPYSRTSDAFRKKMIQEYPDSHFLGFCDKVQEGEAIYKSNELEVINFDYIFILSPNHFESIYNEYSQLVSKSKLFKVVIINNSYRFMNRYEIGWSSLANYVGKLKIIFFQGLCKFLDTIQYKRYFDVFISKDFIGGNNKFLYLYAQQNAIKSMLLTNNVNQYNLLKEKGYHVCKLTAWRAYFYLSLARNIIVDQGDNSALLNLSSEKQRTIQLWHGVPLEHMNLLTDIRYDYFVSTSEYVSQTSFNKVFLSEKFISCGYPRNDVFLKQEQNASDLLFTDEILYALVQEKYGSDEKIVVYMPTFRESDFGAQSSQYNSMAVDFASLNEELKKINSIMIIKLHPFVMVFYQDMIENNPYSNLLFHNIQGDIYPILKYTDILITDYSSVYADFLLLNRPIIFFIYDHGDCSKMAHGYLYEFDEVSPGEKAYSQEELIACIKKINNGNDFYESEREALKREFFDHYDDQSSKRIMELLH